jgi:hypothetical protein
MYQPLGRPPALDGHRERVDDQLLAHMVGHAPAHDPPRERVLDGRQVQPAFPGPQIREVGDPQHVGLLRSELPLDEVIGDANALHPHGCATPLASHKPGDAGLRHQPLDTLASDLDPVRDPQLGLDPRTAVHTTVLGVDRSDLLRQPRVAQLPVRRGTGRPLVIARARHLQQLARQKDRYTRGLLR